MYLLQSTSEYHEQHAVWCCVSIVLCAKEDGALLKITQIRISSGQDFQYLNIFGYKVNSLSFFKPQVFCFFLLFFFFKKKFFLLHTFWKMECWWWSEESHSQGDEAALQSGVMAADTRGIRLLLGGCSLYVSFGLCAGRSLHRYHWCSVLGTSDVLVGFNHQL